MPMLPIPDLHFERRELKAASTLERRAQYKRLGLNSLVASMNMTLCKAQHSQENKVTAQLG